MTSGGGNRANDNDKGGPAHEATATMSHAALKLHVTGIVQGVGFRPFVYRLALRHGLRGRVTNTVSGVEIILEGQVNDLESFVRSVSEEAPPLARIDSVDRASAAVTGVSAFEIGASRTDVSGWQAISPDACTCDDCLSELFDPADRRYRYPFINCTNCGPRFTIIESLPYDRPLTTMSNFSLCPECEAEYLDPANRRFHAEPNACPSCGPSLWLSTAASGKIYCADPLKAAAHALGEGAVVAVKGIGGFQLACAAGNENTVAYLRRRKGRPDKPFALMEASVDSARRFCRISPLEQQLMESPARPIVLLEKLAPDTKYLARSISPGLGTVGVMLPCSPLHFLLMQEAGQPLVMTSGNISDEPICRTNEEAFERLGGIADFFLLHDREIVSTYDDSVVMEAGGDRMILRRARGLAPLPIPLPNDRGVVVLATGGELKNTFCLSRDGQAIVSQHSGDLGDAANLAHFETTISLYEHLFRSEPELVACDAHPDYMSTQYAHERFRSYGAVQQVQHHRAHVASCLAENGCDEMAVGVALDGTGYGDDGHIWGAEFFTGSLSAGFERAAHLEYLEMPGGDLCAREPWRAALAAVHRYRPAKADFVADRMGVPRENMQLLFEQLVADVNTPLASSCGRLFDAVAALITGRKLVSYEAQAAMELEALAAGILNAGASAMHPPLFRFRVVKEVYPWVISPASVIAAIIDWLEGGGDPSQAAWHFHEALAAVIAETALSLAKAAGTENIALSGGVFQNRLLLNLVTGLLKNQKARPLTHTQLPPNDGGLSYGQAALVNAAINS
jgi:hydrogenase maturation protein HypF